MGGKELDELKELIRNNNIPLDKQKNELAKLILKENKEKNAEDEL